MSGSAGRTVRSFDVVGGGGSVPRRWAYRPDLDGLWALAMLAVVAHHYDSQHFGGGYLGVPVFFVLSGYLITGLLTTERNNKGRVDLSAFYARRACGFTPRCSLSCSVP
jgi:peptidoglycan/LPS O-acetylase OafA/YrhL